MLHKHMCTFSTGGGSWRKNPDNVYDLAIGRRRRRRYTLSRIRIYACTEPGCKT